MALISLWYLQLTQAKYKAGLYTVCNPKPLATPAVPPVQLRATDVKEVSNLQGKHLPPLICSQGALQEPEEKSSGQHGHWWEEDLVISLSKVLGLPCMG